MSSLATFAFALDAPLLLEAILTCGMICHNNDTSPHDDAPDLSLLSTLEVDEDKCPSEFPIELAFACTR